MERIAYVATVETGSANPDGTSPEGVDLILEAIPVSVLERVPERADEFDPTVVSEELSFLLLSVDRPPHGLRIAEGSGWFNIEVSSEPRNIEGEFSASAFSFSQEEGESLVLWLVLSTDPVSQNHLAKLTMLSKLAGCSETTKEKIKQALTLPKEGGENLGVVVYDVGQGNFNAIIDAYEHPLVFFDFGLPLPMFRSSLPPSGNFDPVSVARSPEAPVVLSHFDQDHWLYAVQSGRAKWNKSKKFWSTTPTYRKGALQRPWIVRRPNRKGVALGPSHLHLAYTLARTSLRSGHSALHLWPINARSVTAGPITVFACTPDATKASQAYQRNNFSLGLFIREKKASVLLCGDADYESIPHRFRNSLSGIVAPHHGGSVSLSHMPVATGHGQMVLSVGVGCYRSMPDLSMVQIAPYSGWRIARTSDRYVCSKCGAVHGHRLIRLNHTPDDHCGFVWGASACCYFDP